MTSSLFGRIARHPRRTDRDEHEDRLTEIFAAVLDQLACSGLAQHIVGSWITEALGKSGLEDALSLRAMGVRLGTREWSCDVRTQTSTVVDERRRRPDLELRFSSPGASPILVCIEVKHGTKPHTYQLLDYFADLKGRYAGAAQVFLVAPRASYPFDENQVPPSVPEMTWQSTARAARLFQARSVVAQLLLDELMNYL
jgi:hypothetical protein